jgi:DNA polymerase-3 subunit gamma/tau
MENFVVSARKYRPQTFDTVVGQKAITETLRNAIDNNHLAQAFLFCGPRGVGKTSCARILAREINKHTAKQKGESVDQDFSLNILELDAASNNSVDDIRHLTDQVRFPPQVGTHKVYIIDEVHMLSQQAFNAFLKTLEEPPAHAIFILATTEKHKILPTILSRCQIYDFQRITVSDIAEHLAQIAEKEGINAEAEGLAVIAEKADGAMRDALSMFDQLVSFTDSNMTYEAVIKHLNVLDYDYYFKLLDHITGTNIPETILLFNDVLSKGFDGHNFLMGLSQHIRNLMVSKNPKTTGLIETSDTIRKRYAEQSEHCPVRFLLKCLEILNEADVNYRQSRNQRLLVELTLIRLCAIPTEKKNERESPIAENRSSDNQPQRDKEIRKSANPEQEPNIVANTRTDGSHSNDSQVKGSQEIAKENVAESPVAAYADQETPGKPTDTRASDSEESPALESEAKSEDTTAPKAPAVTSSSVQPETSVRRKKIMARYQSASVSISAGLLSEADETTEGSAEMKTESDIPESRPEVAFDEAKLLEIWNELALEMRSRGRESLYSTMTLHKPVLGENYSLHMALANAAQQLEIKQEKGEMLDFLRSKLENYTIELNFSVSQEAQPKGMFTTDQKFEAMVKKNPNLGKLTDKLNLDIY